MYDANTEECIKALYKVEMKIHMGVFLYTTTGMQVYLTKNEELEKILSVYVQSCMPQS